jgi:hypothetical protein
VVTKRQTAPRAGAVRICGDGARLRLAGPSQIGVVIVAMHQRWKLAMFRLERSYSRA